MKLALSGVELADGEDLAALLDGCHDAGAEAVELWWPRNFGDSEPNRVCARLAAAGLSIICISSGIELFRDVGSELQQRNLLELLSLAGAMGVETVSTFFGFSRIRDDERSIEGYIRWLAPCLRHAEALGVTVLLENEFDAFGWDPAASDVTRRPDALRRLADRIGSPCFGLTFDPANFLCADADPLAALDVLLPHVRYVHVKDIVKTTGEPPAPEWREYRDFDRTYVTCPLGQGQTPWPALLRRLFEAEFHGPMCLEPHAATNLASAWRQGAGQLRQWMAFAAGAGVWR